MTAKSSLFELEWSGGAAEHFFRRARPDVDKVPWGTVDTSRYTPELLGAVRGSWTEVSMNEYRAVASFTEVVRALTDAMAPLDMIGMASDFLADEVLHTELAARVAMELGGAAPIAVDMERFALRADLRLPPKKRANETLLRVCCVGEAFALGVGTPALKLPTLPMIKAVTEIIMADESRHKRLGALYLEWASEQWDDDERRRLSSVLEDTMRNLSPLWLAMPNASSGLSSEHLHELGWLEGARALPHARTVALDLLMPLERHGVVLGNEARADLFPASALGSRHEDLERAKLDLG